MKEIIKELRNSTGLSQSKFSKEFGIPIRTLQQWEQGKSQPADYVVRMIQKRISDMNAVDRDIIVKSNVEHPELQNILVVGQGSFGQAMTVYLRNKGYNVRTWKRNEKIESVAIGNDYFIFAVPSQAFREVFTLFSPYIGSSTVVNLAKGIETSALKTLSQICLEIKPDTNYVALSGPSHAEEIQLGLPTDVAISSSNPAILNSVQDLLFQETFRVYTNNDLIGVEIGGAVKNVIAIASGISDGLNFGDNAKAALLTRGLAEMRRLGETLGANPLTFLGLSGVGDLVVTCGSMYSRNRRFGILLGEGKGIEAAKEEIGQIIEGISSCEACFLLAKKYKVDMPITSFLYYFLKGEISLNEAVNLLVSRGRKAE